MIYWNEHINFPGEKFQEKINFLFQKSYKKDLIHSQDLVWQKEWKNEWDDVGQMWLGDKQQREINQLLWTKPDLRR